MVRKYCTFSPDFKLDTVMEGFRGEKSIVQICREREIKDVLYYKWRDTFIENAASVFGGQGDNERQKFEARIAELERMIGQMTIENGILKKSQKLAGLRIQEKRAMI